MLKDDPSEIFKDRVYVFERYEEKYGEIHGNVLDVGAGNGYASIWLAKNCPKVKKIIALEASETAVTKLIPKNTKYHNVEGKVIPQFGSFDDLESEEFDFVIALGALHHSKNLRLTFTCISKLITSCG